jgi:proteic killer suppression protein
MAIQSFNDRVARDFFVSGTTKKGTGWSAISGIVQRKLDLLHYAAELDDLRAPPGNRLELLKGNFEGFHSIRINDQWRIVFRWSEAGPHEVQITDYH